MVLPYIQLYAPLSDKESTFHRTLFVFMCPYMACLLRDQDGQRNQEPEEGCRSVKVFHCQLPCTNPFYSSEPPKNDGSDAPLTGVSQTVERNYNWPQFEIAQEDECEAEKSEYDGLHDPADSSDEEIQLLEDALKVGGDDKSWANFVVRISRHPEQVVRYYGKPGKLRPLWPLSSGRPSDQDIPRCSYCNGPRACEFQILPQLLCYFGVDNDDPDSLDWATIAVFTCEASCDQGTAYKDEFAWVQLSPQST